MSIDERQRHELYEGLVEALGPERADTLMGLVPPVGWADVATKHDLQAQDALVQLGISRLEETLSLRIDLSETRLRKEIGDFRVEMHQELRSQLWGILGGVWVSVVAAVVLNSLLG